MHEIIEVIRWTSGGEHKCGCSSWQIQEDFRSREQQILVLHKNTLR